MVGFSEDIGHLGLDHGQERVALRVLFKVGEDAVKVLVRPDLPLAPLPVPVLRFLHPA